MSAPAPPRRRLRIGRLDLDLRGIDPDRAERAARALGPALAGAITPHPAIGADVDRIDAGRIESPASPGSRDLAAAIARRIAEVLEGKTR